MANNISAELAGVIDGDKLGSGIKNNAAVRVHAATFDLAAMADRAVGATLSLAKRRKGDKVLRFEIACTAAMTSTLSFGTSANATRYAPAVTGPGTPNVPASVIGAAAFAALTGGEDGEEIRATVGGAALPATGTLVILTYLAHR